MISVVSSDKIDFNPKWTFVKSRAKWAVDFNNQDPAMQPVILPYTWNADDIETSKTFLVDFETLAVIAGEWTVSFDHNWGGPKSVLFPELMDWTQHSDEGIKYYSGAAVYKKIFTCESESQESKKYFLQLASVKYVSITEVKINGIDKGIVWTSPFRVEISEELQKGENTLKINL